MSANTLYGVQHIHINRTLIHSMFVCLFVCLFVAAIPLSDNHELHLVNMSVGRVTFKAMAPLKFRFTLCFWLQTRSEGFFIEYEISTEENKTLAFSIFVARTALALQVLRVKKFVVWLFCSGLLFLRNFYPLIVIHLDSMHKTQGGMLPEHIETPQDSKGHKLSSSQEQHIQISTSTKFECVWLNRN